MEAGAEKWNWNVDDLAQVYQIAEWKFDAGLRNDPDTGLKQLRQTVATVAHRWKSGLRSVGEMVRKGKVALQLKSIGGRLRMELSREGARARSPSPEARERRDPVLTEKLFKRDARCFANNHERDYYQERHRRVSPQLRFGV